MGLSDFIDKWRKTAENEHSKRYERFPTWRDTILESIFRPEVKVLNGKEPLSHLHPDTKKLHLPPNIRISDWRKYRVEDHPALIEYQKKCHSSGLHDFWLRNTAYNWYPNMVPRRSVIALFTTNLHKGLALAIAIYIPKYIYCDYYKMLEYEHTPDYVEKYGHEEVFGH